MQFRPIFTVNFKSGDETELGFRDEQYPAMSLVEAAAEIDSLMLRFGHEKPNDPVTSIVATFVVAEG